VKKAAVIIIGFGFSLLLLSLYMCTLTTVDSTGPTLTINTFPDTVTADSLVISGTASDESGILRVRVTTPDTVNAYLPTQTTWTVTVLLFPGLNTFTVQGEDEKNNFDTTTVSVYYKTNYFPLDSGDYWKLVQANGDSFLITVDSANAFQGQKYFFLTLKNRDLVCSTSVYVVPRGNAIKVGPATSIMDATDTLFLSEYTPVTAGYGHVQVTFLGNDTLSGSVYRNCVKITVADTTRQLIHTKEFILAPYKGIISVASNDGRRFQPASSSFTE
jgi:hypothetical protein